MSLCHVESSKRACYTGSQLWAARGFYTASSRVVGVALACQSSAQRKFARFIFILSSPVTSAETFSDCNVDCSSLPESSIGHLGRWLT
jgi:hypothetical protein